MTPNLIRAVAVLLLYLGEQAQAQRLLVAAFLVEQYAWHQRFVSLPAYAVRTVVGESGSRYLDRYVHQHAARHGAVAR